MYLGLCVYCRKFAGGVLLQEQILGLGGGLNGDVGVTCSKTESYNDGSQLVLMPLLEAIAVTRGNSRY